MINLFQSRTIRALTRNLANYLPGGKLWNAKYNPQKNLYMFLEGLAQEANRANELLRAYNDQYYPSETTDFLDEWEQTLALPDDCFQVIGVSDTDRRRNILVKLAGMSIQTVDDFEATALALGVIATVFPGEEAPIVPPVPKFTIVVTFESTNVFPYTFPIIFGSDQISLIECVFRKAAPANCDVIFQSI